MKFARLFCFLVVVNCLFAVSMTSRTLAQPSFNPHTIGRATAAQQRHTDDLLKMPGVVGTAVGLGQDGKPVVKIYVEKRGVAGLPAQLDGVPVVLQETGPIYARPKVNAARNKTPTVSITAPTTGTPF